MDQDQFQEEELHYTGIRFAQRRFPPPVNLDNKPTTRVSWVNNNKKMFINYSCCAEGHTSPQSMLKLQQLNEVVTNYESLSDKDHADVPYNAYENAKAYMDFKKNT